MRVEVPLSALMPVTEPLAEREGVPLAARSGRLARALLFASLLTPLLVVPGILYPYVVPRAVFFRALVAAGLVALVHLVLTRRSDLRHGDATLWALVAFLLVASVAALAGLSPTRSFLGDIERMWGVLTWFHLALYYVLLRTFLDEATWPRFLDGVLLVGAAVVIAGLVQAVGDTRPVSTVGSPGYLAGYLLLLMGVTAARLLETHGSRLRVALAILLAAELALVVLTRTRAALLGLALLCLLGALWLLARGRWPERLATAGALAVLLALGALLWVRPEASLWQHVPGMDRMAASGPEDRMVVWAAAVNAAKERPILGAGMENVHSTIVPFIEPRYYDILDARLYIFDRVHNLVLDPLVTTGAAGLFAYLLVWTTILGTFVVALHRGALEPRTAVPLGAGLLAYLAVLFFWFEDWVSLPLALTIAAYGAHRLHGPLLTFGSVPRRDGTRAAALVALSAIVIGWAVYLHGVRPLRSARLAARAMQTPPGEDRFALYARALRLEGPGSTTILFEVVDEIRAFDGAAPQDRLMRDRALMLADAALEDEIARQPASDLLYIKRAELLRSALLLDPRTALYEAAIASAEGAIARAPTRMRNYHVLAELQLLGRAPEPALRTLETARAFHDGFAETDLLAARAAIQLQRPDEAASWTLSALAAPDIGSSRATLLSIIERLRDEGRAADANHLLRNYFRTFYPLVAEDPASPEFRPTDRPLAARLPLDYLRAGDEVAAREAAELLRAGAPDAAFSVARFLRDLDDGRPEPWLGLESLPLPEATP